MYTMNKIITHIIAVLILSGNLHADTLIHAGKLIDGFSNKIHSNMTIHVDGSRIKEITSGFSVATENDTIIDLKNQTVMPGLMDTHVHLTGEYSANSHGKTDSKIGRASCRERV